MCDGRELGARQRRSLRIYRVSDRAQARMEWVIDRRRALFDRTGLEPEKLRGDDESVKSVYLTYYVARLSSTGLT